MSKIIQQLEQEQLRLSIKGSQLVGQLATKNVLTLNDEEFAQYVKGESFFVEQENGIYLVKHGNDFCGTSKIGMGKVHTFLPKERRLKVVNQ